MKTFSINTILKTFVLGFPLLSIFYTLYLLSTSKTVIDNSFNYGIMVYFIACIGALKMEYSFTFLKFWTNKISTLGLGITLFLACFNLISFSHVQFGFSMKLSFLPSFGFNPLYLIIFILYLFAYKKELNEIFPNSDSNTIEQEKELFESNVNQFINKYDEKSIIELEKIVNSSDCYCKSAVEASKRILETKTKDA